MMNFYPAFAALTMKQDGYRCGQKDGLTYSQKYPDEATGKKATAEIVQRSEGDIVCEKSYSGYSPLKIGGISAGLALLTFGIVKQFPNNSKLITHNFSETTMDWNIRQKWGVKGAPVLADCPPDNAATPDAPAVPPKETLADDHSSSTDKLLDRLHEIRQKQAAGKGTAALAKEEANIHEKLRADFAEQTLSDVMPKPEDVKLANELNAKFDALGIPRYAVCKRGGGLTFRKVADSCVDKPNVTATSPAVTERYLEKTWNISMSDIKNKPLSELRPDVEAAKAKMTPEVKAEVKADAAQTDKLDAKPAHKPAEHKPAGHKPAEHKAEEKPDKPKRKPPKPKPEKNEHLPVSVDVKTPKEDVHMEMKNEAAAEEGLNKIEALLNKAIAAKGKAA